LRGQYGDCTDDGRARECQAIPVPAIALSTIRVRLGKRGAWQVSLAGRQECTICPTLEGARRLAQMTAERCHPCELIILDAYHRVLEYAVLGDPRERAPVRGRITAE
jgi:hypothetical protein